MKMLKRVAAAMAAALSVKAADWPACMEQNTVIRNAGKALFTNVAGTVSLHPLLQVVLKASCNFFFFPATGVSNSKSKQVSIPTATQKGGTSDHGGLYLLRFE